MWHPWAGSCNCGKKQGEGEGELGSSGQGILQLYEDLSISTLFNPLPPQELLKPCLYMYEGMEVHDFIAICKIFIYMYKFVHTHVMRRNIYCPNGWHQNSTCIGHCVRNFLDKPLDWRETESERERERQTLQAKLSAGPPNNKLACW